MGGGLGVAASGFGFGSNPNDPAWSFGGATSAFIVLVEVVAGFFRHGAAAGETANLSWQYY
jgi:hypothetical protein